MIFLPILPFTLYQNFYCILNHESQLKSPVNVGFTHTNTHTHLSVAFGSKAKIHVVYRSIVVFLVSSLFVFFIMGSLVHSHAHLMVSSSNGQAYHIRKSGVTPKFFGLNLFDLVSWNLQGAFLMTTQSTSLH